MTDSEVLKALANTTMSDGEVCVGFRVLSEELNAPWPESRAEIRVRVRRLARKGLVEYFKALISDAGEFAGAGYCVTKEGLKQCQ